MAEIKAVVSAKDYSTFKGYFLTLIGTLNDPSFWKSLSTGIFKSKNKEDKCSLVVGENVTVFTFEDGKPSKITSTTCVKDCPVKTRCKIFVGNKN